MIAEVVVNLSLYFNFKNNFLIEESFWFRIIFELNCYKINGINKFKVMATMKLDIEISGFLHECVFSCR